MRELRQAGCVYPEDEADLMLSQAENRSELSSMISKRQAGLPLEHILGWTEFCGLRVAITPGVFIPRFKTEFLVEQAISVCVPGARVLDMCCGSGALGMAIKSVAPSIELFASDCDPKAVECARTNLTPLDAHVFIGDLFGALPSELQGTFDRVLANAPYVPTPNIGLMPREAREFEPRISLDGGDDGLDIHRRIAVQARDWLAPRGKLFIEIGETQIETAATIFERAQLNPRIVTDEEHEAVVLIARKSA